MSSYTYSVEENGDATFRVQPAKRPFFGFWLGIGLVGAFTVFGLFAGPAMLGDGRSAPVGLAITIGALLCGLMVAFQVLWSRSAKYRKPVSFVVSPYCFTMNGQEVSLNRVNDLEIRNAMDGAFRLETGAFYAGAGGLGMAAAGAMAAAHSGALAIDAARFVRWRSVRFASCSSLAARKRPSPVGSTRRRRAASLRISTAQYARSCASPFSKIARIQKLGSNQ